MKKTLSALLIVVLLAFTFEARGANVYGNAQDIFGVDYGTTAIFTPSTTPIFSDGKLVSSTPRYVTITNGFIGASNLVANLYTLDIGAPNKPLKIIVPGNDGDFTLEYCASLATNRFTFVYPNQPNGMPVVAGYGLIATTNNGVLVLSVDTNIIGGQPVQVATVTADNQTITADNSSLTADLN